MSLLETLKKSSLQTRDPGISDAAEQTERVLAAKLAGQAVTPGSGPAASQQASKLAAAEGQKQFESQGIKGRLQDLEVLERAKSQEEQLNQAERTRLQDLRLMRDKFQSNAQRMLEDFSQKRAELGEEERQNQMETIGQHMRLSNRSYLDSLERAGQERRLTDKIGADEAYAQAAMSGSISMLRDDLIYKAMSSADERQFREQLAAMDIDFATKMAQEALGQEQKSAMYSSVPALFTAVAKVYEEDNKKK